MLDTLTDIDNEDCVESIRKLHENIFFGMLFIISA